MTERDPEPTEYIMPGATYDELLELLSEAAVEITNLDSSANPVAVRLRAMIGRLEA